MNRLPDASEHISMQFPVAEVRKIDSKALLVLVEVTVAIAGVAFEILGVQRDGRKEVRLLPGLGLKTSMGSGGPLFVCRMRYAPHEPVPDSGCQSRTAR